MGMFSGGFLGSGSDESTTSSTSISNITEKIGTGVLGFSGGGDDSIGMQTTARDIMGVTGADAVMLGSVLGSVSRDVVGIGSGLVERVTQEQGRGFHQLVGGANQLISTGAAQNVHLAEESGNVLGKLADTFTSFSNRLSGSLDKTQGSIIDYYDRVAQDRSQEYDRMITISGGLLNPDLALAQSNQKQLVMVVLGLAALILFTFAKKKG